MTAVAVTAHFTTVLGDDLKSVAVCVNNSADVPERCYSSNMEPDKRAISEIDGTMYNSVRNHGWPHCLCF